MREGSSELSAEILPEKSQLRKKMNSIKRLTDQGKQKGCSYKGLLEACRKQWAQLSKEENISLLLLENHERCPEASLIIYSTRVGKCWWKFMGPKTAKPDSKNLNSFTMCTSSVGKLWGTTHRKLQILVIVWKGPDTVNIQIAYLNHLRFELHYGFYS